MRINRYVASAAGIGRRQADKLIAEGQIEVDGKPAVTGQDVSEHQAVTLNHRQLELPKTSTTIILNKPVGLVVSRDGQGADTIYSILPENYQLLKPVGRLDKDSSGLLIMTNDGALSQRLAHPSFNKQKVYQVTLDRDISKADQNSIVKGVRLEDGISKFEINSSSSNYLVVTLSEGRNRQIRRTFKTLGYNVTKLNRIKFGQYDLESLASGQYLEITP
jgi:23S rRNA pseudouridine2605 synthase